MEVRTRSGVERRARCRSEVPTAIVEKHGDVRRLVIGHHEVDVVIAVEVDRVNI
jgi:hypothetical protein